MKQTGDRTAEAHTFKTPPKESKPKVVRKGEPTGWDPNECWEARGSPKSNIGLHPPKTRTLKEYPALHRKSANRLRRKWSVENPPFDPLEAKRRSLFKEACKMGLKPRIFVNRVTGARWWRWDRWTINEQMLLKADLENALDVANSWMVKEKEKELDDLILNGRPATPDDCTVNGLYPKDAPYFPDGDEE